MKRILQVIPSLELGGTEAFVMNHYRVIDRNELQFDFLTFAEKKWPYLEEIEHLGGRVYYAPAPSLLHVRRFYKAFRETVKSGGPYEVIHCHADCGNAVPLLCGLLLGIRVRISHMHSVAQTPYKWVHRGILCLRKRVIRLAATKYLACSEAAGASLYGKNCFDRCGAVVNNGICVKSFVNPNLHKVEALKREFRITEQNDLVIGNISRFDDNKNQLFAVEVFRHILRRYPNALLLLGGVDAGFLPKVQEYVSNCGIEQNVRFVGKRNDIAECLKLIDVYLLPSKREGFGISLLEAQASGCLCVASTGVPAEANVGLGNISYLNLEDGAVHWAAFICEKFANGARPAEESVCKAFAQKGFDVLRSAEELVKHYE